MQTLVALLVVTAAACAIARPPGSTMSGAPAQAPSEEYSPPLSSSAFLGPYYMSPLLNYQGYEESPRIPAAGLPNHDWLNKEIDRISQMEEAEDTFTPYEADLSQWISQDPYIRRILEVPIMKNEISEISPETLSSNIQNLKYLEPMPYTADEIVRPLSIKGTKPLKKILQKPNETEDYKREFALTPRDKGYFDSVGEVKSEEIKAPSTNGPPNASELRAVPIFEPPRQTRQNPNLRRTKTLVTENLDRLKTGLANKDYRLPVSLLPTNLRWLKINDKPVHDDDDDDKESSHEDREPTVKSNNYHMSETGATDVDSVYSMAFVAVILATVTVSVIALLVGWYTLSKKAKAAAEVDYPAYGVTGPTIDSSGDRKLAHSAHMYHYQHQKQQIIAMERSGLEQRNGSVSDPESEEENEEGDYTVYECPGFATTGDMEVKNPLFSEDPTPATPGKCEVVKPQPKE